MAGDWLVRVAHLAVGIVAIGLAERRVIDTPEATHIRYRVRR